MNLPREIGWMRRKCQKLSEITNVMHTFIFDGDTILFVQNGNRMNVVASGTFEEFEKFQREVWKYYAAVVQYFYQKGFVSNLVQPVEKFIYMGSYKRKVL